MLAFFFTFEAVLKGNRYRERPSVSGFLKAIQYIIVQKDK